MEYMEIEPGLSLEEYPISSTDSFPHILVHIAELHILQICGVH
jgi:hypothetical protein